MRLPRSGSLSLAALGGALLLAPNDPRLLALSGFCGLSLLSESLERSGDPARRELGQAALRGLVFGTAANATALFSLIDLLGSFAHLHAPLALALSVLAFVVQALPFALAAALS
ncbi:MAG: hypothetical protein JWN48_2398, partial [Myxococcaceae bacterium]|nr:hypothetical protein [Myxococcaceae bacterium]